MILEYLFERLVSVVPRPVKRTITRWLESCLHNRAMIRTVRDILYLLIALLLIFCMISFAGLLIMLAAAVLIPL